MHKNNRIIIALIMVTVGVVCRLLPHAWNAAPVAAIALFAGVYLGPRYALVLPIIAMLIGDIFIGFYDWQLMLAVYASYVMIGGIGCLLKKYKNAGTVLAGSIFSSILFFLATNWAVWQFSSWYAPTWNGLIECYTMAIPFFRSTMLGDLFFVATFFGAYEIIAYAFREKRLTYNIANIK